MLIKLYTAALMLLIACNGLNAQNVPPGKHFITEAEDPQLSAKILHAEPLYIDLIRDLGARKGEKEWNLGVGLTDNLDYDTYEGLIEYEFAPLNRLGVELELPFIYYAERRVNQNAETPAHKLESIKAATQWSFLVNTRYNLSMAIGYINEFQLAPLNSILQSRIITGNVYNPFFIVAKQWGSNWHTLLYTGPHIEQSFANNNITTHYSINSNLHYMIPGTRNFAGIEVNKEIHHHDFDMTIRPQLRVSISENLLIGIIGGIPIKRENERLSTFARIIWELHNKMNKKQ